MFALLESGQLTAVDRLILMAVEQQHKGRNTRDSFWEAGMFELYWIEPTRRDPREEQRLWRANFGDTELTLPHSGKPGLQTKPPSKKKQVVTLSPRKESRKPKTGFTVLDLASEQLYRIAHRHFLRESTSAS